MEKKHWVILLVLCAVLLGSVAGMARYYKDPGIDLLYSRRINRTTRMRFEQRNDCDDTLGTILRYAQYIPVVGPFASEWREARQKTRCTVVTTYFSPQWGGATRVSRRH